ncbi:MAG: efflux RND transporter periplasmic adaptor subunit [Prevotella sp.]|jgi:cobalt-zinc-cadmium efflux system membrane fusion protein|nr:efflux RND transporter periplasmic adaptor subunit [Prevotella sp.]MCI2080329.1 efflux RND transporter periplasmic adaptor subunit [Prevotella sp.]MCI2101941.1 efflux RND transporter periplasmic adaptor subunit [Prevotella sp.]
MKKILFYIAFPFLAMASFSACGGKTAASSEDNADANATKEAEVSDVTLTDAQVRQLKITIGEMPEYQFSGRIEANGTLAVMPQSVANVSPFSGANVRKILVREGQEVARGQVLAILTHPDLLDLQGRYLDAYNRLLYVAQEYKRQQKLYQAHVGSGKDYQQIFSEYRTLQGQLRTTGAQLRMMGINPGLVAKGKTVSSIALRAPIRGTVEQIQAATGQYVDNQLPMFKIVNFDHVYADLLVFEKDLPSIKVGQQVDFVLKSAGGARYTGKVYSIGKIFDSEPKAAHVRATIQGPNQGWVEGLYLCGKVATDVVRRRALSSDGMVEENGKAYAFTVTRQKGTWTFHPVRIEKGREENDYVEVKQENNRLSHAQFALTGAYYILSEMKKAETGEED